MANKKQNKHKNNQTKGETQIPQPDMRFAIQRSKAKGAGPPLIPLSVTDYDPVAALDVYNSIFQNAERSGTWKQ